MKTYGRLEWEEKKRRWRVSCAPHVMARLKRLFERIQKTEFATVSLHGTPEIARELSWFMERFPLEMDAADRARLETAAATHRLTEQAIETILAPQYQPLHYDLALPLRPYQRVSVDLVLAARRLLLADDVGLGKTAQALGVIAAPLARPALVVTLAHLPRQWEAEIARFLPGLRTHILRTGQPYDLTVERKRTLPFPDVIVTNYHKLAGWAETLAPLIRTVVFDECQELRHADSAKWAAARHLAESATYRMGLSVGPESALELWGGPFHHGWVGPISEAFEKVAEIYTPKTEGAYDVVDVTALGVTSRGWDGEGFSWKKVKTFIRHPCDKPVKKVTLKGENLLVTEDHSVYVARTGGLSHVPGGSLSPGDIVPADNGRGWEEGVPVETPVDVIELSRAISKAQVVVDLRGLKRQDLGLDAWTWGNCHKEATYGTRLPVEVFLRYRSRLPKPTKVYIGRGKAPSAPCFVNLSEWAYVLGFFLGDGFLGSSSVTFSVDFPHVEGLLKELESLPLNLCPRVKPCKSRSVEIACSNKMFAEILRSELGKKPCYEKNIPGSWLVTWPKKARLELLRGLVDSDGTNSNQKRNRAGSHYGTTSRNLAWGVAALVRSLGVTPSVHTNFPTQGGVVQGRRIVGRRLFHTVNWSTHAMRGDNEGRRGKRFSLGWTREVLNEVRVWKTLPADPPPFVYDLEMEGHPSFTASGFLVHNSATPIYNQGGEIYSVLSVIAPDALGSRAEFSREWCRTSSTSERARIVEPRAFGQYLREQGLMLRRTRAEVGREIPAVTRIPYEVEADLDAMNAVAPVAAELATVLLSQAPGAKGEKMRAAEELSWRLRQATGIAKAPYVAAFVKLLLESGEKVLLYGYHHAVYELWREALAEWKPVFYTGAESAAEKDAAKNAFVTGTTPLLIMSLRAGAGLDGLQAVCRTCVVGELDWSPGVHEQCIGRVARDGQKEPVAAYFLIADTGSDPVIAEVLGLKRAQVEGIRNPQMEDLEALAVDPDHLRTLAQRYLEQRGLTVPTEKVDAS